MIFNVSGFMNQHVSMGINWWKTDCNFFDKVMIGTMHRYFENVEDQVLLQSPLIYCHFAKDGADPCYKPVKVWEPLRNMFEEFLESYSEMHASMNLVIFEDAMQYVCWISHILEALMGYALLIGVGGSDKQSLLRLAAYICSLEVLQITVKKDDGIQELRDSICDFTAYAHTTVEDLKSKLASQEAELQLKYQDAEPLIAKIGFQTEKVSQEKAIADAEEQKVLDSNLCKLTASLEEVVAEKVQRQDYVNRTNKTIELTNRLVRRLETIERALACGGTVLTEYMSEAIDLILDLLCGRHTVKKGKYIKTEDKEGEFNKNFCLILHTKLANPHYKPELQAQTTVINFTVTRDGLEDQLLAEVVSAERPDLEKCKSVLAKQQNCFKTELGQLEDDMLSSLSAAQGSFLDNSELVEKLKTTKSTAAEIQHKIAEAKENEAQTNMTRDHYRPTATRASVLYFFINSLDSINPIDHFSLKILLRSKEIELHELDFVFQFGVEHAYKTPVDFLTMQSWSAIKAMSVMDVFKGLDKDIERSIKRWKRTPLNCVPEKGNLEASFLSLCYFHTCAARRLKFDPQGWNGRSWFSAGDLTICICVLCNYLQSRTKFEGKLALAPPNLDYAGYHKYTDEMLPSESPVLYGLHHNAEVGYLTAASDNLFKTLLEMLPMNSSVGEGSGQSAEENVKFFIWVTDLLIQHEDPEIWTEGLVLKWCGFLACSILTPF
ncbi:hypothetical protein Q9966_010932 [Columba livia]|nr:hypothetical protein Q9966_010932 [Columba livia]